MANVKKPLFAAVTNFLVASRVSVKGRRVRYIVTQERTRKAIKLAPTCHPILNWYCGKVKVSVFVGIVSVTGVHCVRHCRKERFGRILLTPVTTSISDRFNRRGLVGSTVRVEI